MNVGDTVSVITVNSFDLGSHQYVGIVYTSNDAGFYVEGTRRSLANPKYPGDASTYQFAYSEDNMCIFNLTEAVDELQML